MRYTSTYKVNLELGGIKSQYEMVRAPWLESQTDLLPRRVSSKNMEVIYRICEAGIYSLEEVQQYPILQTKN